MNPWFRDGLVVLLTGLLIYVWLIAVSAFDTCSIGGP